MYPPLPNQSRSFSSASCHPYLLNWLQAAEYFRGGYTMLANCAHSLQTVDLIAMPEGRGLFNQAAQHLGFMHTCLQKLAESQSMPETPADLSVHAANLVRLTKQARLLSDRIRKQFKRYRATSLN